MTVDRTAVRCTWGGGYLPPGNYVFLITSRPFSGVYKAPYKIPAGFGGWGWGSSLYRVWLNPSKHCHQLSRLKLRTAFHSRQYRTQWCGAYDEKKIIALQRELKE
jgi:hypothetical protein